MSVASLSVSVLNFFFFKQKTAYEIRNCDWSSDVCSSDLGGVEERERERYRGREVEREGLRGRERYRGNER